MFLPQRARDATVEELILLLDKYKRLIVMIKYDGVRCIVKNKTVYGKSMLPITNNYIQKLYGNIGYEDKEFEITVTDNGEYNPLTCCRETVSFTNSDNIEKEHRCVMIDDYSLGDLSFENRLEFLKELTLINKPLVLPGYIVATTIEEILTFENMLLEKDHEAIIIRNPYLSYKEGMSSKEGELLRLKRYISEEAIIEEIIPAFKNLNEAKTNALGRKERSNTLSGKEPKEEIGKLLCRTVKDIYDPWSKRLIIKKGSLCVVAPGNMTKKEKIDLYRNKEILKGEMISFKSFPKGTKDKPRYATFSHFVPKFDQP